VLQHSCVSPVNSGFSGDPAVRIRAVINSTPDSVLRQSTSVCDTSYQQALAGLGQMITAQLVGGCLGSLSNPQCIVEDVTRNPDGTTSVTTLPACSSSGGAKPCWTITTDAQCGGARLAIDRGGAPVPPNTTTNAQCTASS
jgi:hypothetical protein